VAAYIQLTEAEAAFHIHKSDLGSARCGIRKKSSAGHILVCFLPTSLEDLAASCREADGTNAQVFEALSEIAMVDVVLPTRSGK